MKHKRVILVAIVFLSYFLFYVLLVGGFSLNAFGMGLSFRKISPVFVGYPLLRARESIQAKLIFGEEDRAHWDLVLAERRIGEKRSISGLGFSGVEARLNSEISADLTEAKELLDRLSKRQDINYLQVKLDALSVLK